MSSHQCVAASLVYMHAEVHAYAIGNSLFCLGAVMPCDIFWGSPGYFLIWTSIGAPVMMLRHVILRNQIPALAADNASSQAASYMATQSQPMVVRLKQRKKGGRNQKHNHQTPPVTPTYTPPDGIRAIACTPEHSGRLLIIRNDPRISGFAAEVSNAIHKTANNQQEHEQSSTCTICVVGTSATEASAMHETHMHDGSGGAPKTPTFTPTGAVDVFALSPCMHAMHEGSRGAKSESYLASDEEGDVSAEAPVATATHMHETLATTDASRTRVTTALFATFLSEDFDDSQPLLSLAGVNARGERYTEPLTIAPVVVASTDESVPAKANLGVCAHPTVHQVSPLATQVLTAAVENVPHEEDSRFHSAVEQRAGTRSTKATVSTGAPLPVSTVSTWANGVVSTGELPTVLLDNLDSPVATNQRDILTHACSLSMMDMQLPAETAAGSSCFHTAMSTPGVGNSCTIATRTLDDLVTDSVARACMSMSPALVPSLVEVNTAEALTAVAAIQTTMTGMNSCEYSVVRFVVPQHEMPCTLPEHVSHDAVSSFVVSVDAVPKHQSNFQVGRGNDRSPQAC